MNPETTGGGWEYWASLVIEQIKQVAQQISALAARLDADLLALRKKEEMDNAALWRAVGELKTSLEEIRKETSKDDHQQALDIQALQLQARSEGQAAGQKEGLTYGGIATIIVAILQWLWTNLPR